MDINTTSEAIILAQMQFDFWKDISIGVAVVIVYSVGFWGMSR